jgi:hypothetical protein
MTGLASATVSLAFGDAIAALYSRLESGEAGRASVKILRLSLRFA